MSNCENGALMHREGLIGYTKFIVTARVFKGLNKVLETSRNQRVSINIQ